MRRCARSTPWQKPSAGSIRRRPRPRDSGARHTSSTSCAGAPTSATPRYPSGRACERAHTALTLHCHLRHPDTEHIRPPRPRRAGTPFTPLSPPFTPLHSLHFTPLSLFTPLSPPFTPLHFLHSLHLPSLPSPPFISPSLPHSLPILNVRFFFYLHRRAPSALLSFTT